MKKQNDDIINAILGAAILGGLAEQAKQSEPAPAPQNEVNEQLDRALELRKQYDAFLQVGFTEEQATAFIAALLH